MRLALGAGLLAVFPTAWVARPWLDDRWTVCFFRTATGWRCPLCGLTRACAAATHGDWRQAVAFHPLWWAAAAAVTAAAAVLFGEAVRGHQVLARRGRWAWAALAAFVAATVFLRVRGA